MAIFHFINWTVTAEAIKGGKLFKGGNYLRKHGSFQAGCGAGRQTCYLEVVLPGTEIGIIITNEIILKNNNVEYW